jgi:hypothetical protein
MTHLMPRQPVPALTVSLLNGDAWTLAEQKPEHFTLMVFYRGLHCPRLSHKNFTRLRKASNLLGQSPKVTSAS